MSEPLLELHALTKTFGARTGMFGHQHQIIKAVDAVDLNIHAGETLGLVGESGCGKSTLGRMILRIIEPTSGSIRFRMEEREYDLTSLRGSALHDVRQHIQMIFQDPFSSLNPRHRAFDIISEPLRALTQSSSAQIRDRVFELAQSVGLNVNHLKRFPHAFSGGQRQRIGIARALAVNPALVICDEPVSALDVSVQAQIINMLTELQSRHGFTYLFVAHDLAVVRNISARVAVMYAGRIVELGPTRAVFEQPLHPYTETLLAAIPVPDPTITHTWNAQPPNDTDAGEDATHGCLFARRCRYAEDRCRQEIPPLRSIEEGPGSHTAACHFAGKIQLTVNHSTRPQATGESQSDS